MTDDIIYRLRAELAVAKGGLDAAVKDTLKYRGENDELRELLREAREYVADMPIVGDELLARIDASLNKGGARD